MAIADKITALQTIKSDIKDAITTKTGVDAGDNMTTYADKILAITTGGSSTPCGSGNNHVDANGVWNRPEEWDDIESMVIPEGNSELYFLFGNHINGGSFCRLRAYGTGMQWSRGHVSNGVFTPSTSYVSVANGGYISIDLEDLEDDYSVIHLKGTTITSCGTGSSLGKYTGLNASLNTCLMRYGRLPKATSLVFSCQYLESDNVMDFAKDLSNTSLTLASTYSSCYNLARWRHSGWNIARNKTSALSGVFFSCFNLVDVDDLDFTGWCSATTTTIANFMGSCYCLNKEVIVKNWDVKNVTTMQTAFSNCYFIPKMTGLETWTVAEKCTTTNSMFSQTRSLCCTIDVSSLKCGTSTGVFNNVVSMFSYCYATKIVIKGWNFSNITTNFTSVFANAINAKVIDISDCVFGSSITSYASLFSYCYKLEELVLDGLKFSGIPTGTQSAIQHIASYCYSLKKLSARNCEVLTGIEYKDTASSYGYVFYYDYQLEYLDASWIDMTIFTSTNAHRLMFAGLNKLIDLYPPLNISKDFTISASTLLSHDSLVRIINNLVTTTATTKPKLIIGTINQAKLTDEEKQLVTDKGWALG